MGRLIFNEPIPQDLGFVDRADPEAMFDLEINFVCGKKQLGKIIDKCITARLYHRRRGARYIKALGYKYSTLGASDGLRLRYDRPGGEVHPSARPSSESSKIEDAVQAAASSPTTSATACRQGVGKDHQGRHRRPAGTWTATTPSS